MQKQNDAQGFSSGTHRSEEGARQMPNGASLLRALLLSGAMIASLAGTAYAVSDSNSSDAGSGESSCEDDANTNGGCSTDGDDTDTDTVEQTDSEMDRDEDACENNGAAGSGDGEEEIGGPTELNPVAWVTGEKWEQESDLIIRLPGADYRFTRQYTSDPSKADNPYDDGNTLPSCAEASNLSANIGKGWGWSNLRAATGKRIWESGGEQTYFTASTEMTIYRPARAPRYISGSPGSPLTNNGPGNQLWDLDVDGDPVDLGGPEPSPCYNVPSTMSYTEPGRWTQTYNLSEGVGWIIEDTDVDGNYRLYKDIDQDGRELPDRILLNGTSTTWNDSYMVDAWIEIQWDDDRVVRADVYRPTASGGVITQTVQYFHLVDDSGLKVKYHDGTSYTTLNLPGTSTAVTPASDLGTEGDLVMVMRSVANDPGNGSTDWRRFITQYRYHDGTTAGTETDIRLEVEGAEHQLKSVFKPQQIEYMAQQLSAAGSPDDLTVFEEAVALLELEDDDPYDGPSGSGAEMYTWPNKIVTYDSTTDKVDFQFLQAASCGCGSGGAYNAIGYDYEWSQSWTTNYRGTNTSGLSLHIREYEISGFTSWPSTVERSFMKDILYINAGVGPKHGYNAEQDQRGQEVTV